MSVWGILFLIKHSTTGLMFEILTSLAVGVFIFVKDNTNQNVVDYISYILKFAVSQRVYKYDNRIEDEEEYIIKEYMDSLAKEY